MTYGKANRRMDTRVQGTANGGQRSLWKSMPMWLKVLIGIGLGLGGIGVGVGLFGGGSGDGGDSSKKPGVHQQGAKKPKDKPSKAKKPKRTAASATVAGPVEQPAVETNEVDTLIHLPHLPPKYKIKSVESCKTNSYGQIVTRFTTIDNKTHLSVRRARPPAFQHVTDQLLAMAMRDNPKSRLAPMPGLAANADMSGKFIESLSTPIEIKPDDSPELAAKKKAVIEARLEMAKLMKSGMTFEEALNEHQKLANENAALHGEAMTNLRKLYQAGASEDDIGEYVKKVNEELQALGAEPVSVTDLEDELKDDGSDK